MKLYYFPMSPNSRRVVAVLHQLQLECEFQVVDLFKGEQLEGDMVTLNPNHMIPVLVDEDLVFWESNAIMQYLCTKVASTPLWPANGVVQADISRWQFWHVAHFGSTCSTLVFERLKKFLDMGEPDSAEIARAEERFHRFAQVLERHLTGRAWLVGDNATLADFAVGSSLGMHHIAQYPLAPYSEINRWYAQLEQIQAWQSSASEIDIEL